MDLYRQQARNRRATLALLAVFVLLLAGLGFVLDVGVLGTWPPTRPYDLPWGSLGALGFGAVSAAGAFFEGDRVVLAGMRARPVNPERLAERQFQNVAEEMAIAAGLPTPKLYVVPDPDPNAFATGRDPHRAAIAVTEGLLEALDREELQAVVAHEMGHVRNLDIRTMTVVGVLAGTIAIMADLILRTHAYGGARRRGRDAGGLGFLIPLGLLLAVLAPLLARLLELAVSRVREFEADRSGAELTRNPLALASALTKIEAHGAPTRVATRATAGMFIVDPRLAAHEGEGAHAWLRTHPPMAQRLARLRAMAHGGLTDEGASKPSP